MERNINRQDEIRSLSNKDFVSKINREIITADETARLHHLFTEASIAEAEGRLSINEGRGFYGNLAVAAINMALKDIKEFKGVPAVLIVASHVQANSSLRLSIAASERMVRGLENQTPDKT